MTEKNKMGVEQLSEQDIELVAGGTAKTDTNDGLGGADFDWESGGAGDDWGDDGPGGANAGWGTDPVSPAKSPLK